VALSDKAVKNTDGGCTVDFIREGSPDAKWANGPYPKTTYIDPAGRRRELYAWV